MGDQQARFEQIYLQHHRDVRRYVGRRLVEPEVDDATADVFVVAWRRLAELPPDDRVLPWLYSVARRVLANEYRRARRARTLVEQIGEQQPNADHADAVADRMAVAAAFDDLTEADQEIIRLVAWESLNSTQVAAVLGCARTTAAMRISRARRRLSRALHAPPAAAVALPVVEQRGISR